MLRQRRHFCCLLSNLHIKVFPCSPWEILVLFLCLGLCSPYRWTRFFFIKNRLLVRLRAPSTLPGLRGYHRVYPACELCVEKCWLRTSESQKMGPVVWGNFNLEWNQRIKVGNLTHELPGRWNLRTKRPISRECLIYRIFGSAGIFLADGGLVSLFHISLRTFC